MHSTVVDYSDYKTEQALGEELDYTLEQLCSYKP